MRRRDEVERLELGFVSNFKQWWPRIKVQDHHLALTDEAKTGSKRVNLWPKSQIHEDLKTNTQKK